MQMCGCIFLQDVIKVSPDSCSMTLEWKMVLYMFMQAKMVSRYLI